MPAARSALVWYAQRVTGALLVPLLVAHFWVEHFMSKTLLRGDLSYDVILSRISNPLWQGIDVGFLLVALVHGLIGLRVIMLDYSWVGPKAARAVTTLLVVVGGVWAWWGIQAFSKL